jgi:hypothetical protein
MAATTAGLEVLPRPGLQAAGGRRWSWGVFLLALVAMLALYHQMWANPAQRTLGSANHTNDPMQMMWFLEWVPRAVLHGHNPFHTNAIFYPEGVSLTWNTFVPTLGILAAPVTLTLGAAVGFACLMTLGPPLTALTGFWWLRRHTERPAAAAVGALLLAFNPFVVGHMLGHLNLVFLPLIPLILMLAEDLLWRRPRPMARTAVYLGLTAGAQLGISEEVLLIVIIEAALGLAVAIFVMPGRTGQALVASWRGIALAVGVFLAVSAPLLISQLFLARPLIVPTQRFRAVPGDYLYSLHRQWLVPSGRHHSYLGGAEGGVYLGWAVIAILVVGVALTLRDRRVRVMAAVLAVSVLLTFGTNGLDLDWLPWRLLAKVPAVESILPSRFALGSFLVIAWLIAQWLDRLLAAAPGHDGRPSPAPARAVRRAAALAVVGALVLTFLPRPVGATRLPAHVAFFGSATERSLLAEGSPILLLPAPWFGDASGMYYQQLDDFRFSVPTGYALTSDTGNDPRAQLLRRFVIRAQTGGREPVGPAVSVADARAAAHAIGLRAVVVVLNSPTAAQSMALATSLTQRPADLIGDEVAIWRLTPAQQR